MSNENSTVNATNIANQPIIISGPPPNVPLADGGGTGFWRLPFIIAGNPYSAKIYTIEAHGSLPLGSELQMRLPNTLKQQLNVQLVTGLPFGDTIGIPLPENKQTKIGEGCLQPGSSAYCAMEIKVPGNTYWEPGVWEFAISQSYQENEVGRVTWRFGQPAKY
jgi:hypothetical protein